MSQFLSLNAPETEKTHHFLNARTIALLPQGAIVVNTARGGLVVDEDLIAALKSGHLAAAGLDVFDGEPKLNPGYVELKNIFLLPHIGTATHHTRGLMAQLVIDNVISWFEGKGPITPVAETPVPARKQMDKV